MNFFLGLVTAGKILNQTSYHGLKSIKMGKYKQKPFAENIPLRLGSLRLPLKEWNQVGSK